MILFEKGSSGAYFLRQHSDALSQRSIRSLQASEDAQKPYCSYISKMSENISHASWLGENNSLASWVC